MSAYEEYCKFVLKKFQQELTTKKLSLEKLITLLEEYSSVLEKRRKSHCTVNKCVDTVYCDEKNIEYRYNEIGSELVFNMLPSL